METKRIPLLFSDNRYGTHEFGFFPRVLREDDDEAELVENFEYARHVSVELTLKGTPAFVRIVSGTLIIEPVK